MKKAVIYSRVSSKEQEESGYSLDAQEKLLNQYAAHKGIEVVNLYKISESATGKQIRKTFSEMLAFATKKNVPIILCEKIDRLTRNLKDAALVSDWLATDDSREIHFVKENFVVNKNTRAHENLVWDMKVAIARFYTNNLSEEVKKGQKEKISQGWLPTKPPIGYKTIGDKGHKIHVVDQEKAPFIKRMFELYSSGNYSTIALVDILFKEGLRNRIGKKVGKSRVYDLLTDPFYCGSLSWKGCVYPAKQEPIITKQLFDRVQQLLCRPLSQPQFQKHLPVFKAKLTCGDCEGSVTWETHKGHWYGHCSGYKRQGMKDKCPSRSNFIRQEKVEEFLFPFLENVAPKNQRVLEILEEALKESHKDEIQRFNLKLSELNRTVEVSQRRLEVIYEDKIDGKISGELYEKLSSQYGAAKAEAALEIEHLNEGNKQYYLAGYAVHELASKAMQIYQGDKTTNDDRRMLLSYAFSNIIISGRDIKPVYSLAFDFLANWVPKLNLILEPEKTIVNKGKESTFVLSHPILLRE